MDPLATLLPYRPPLWLRSGHVQTAVGSIFRTVEDVEYQRERLELADGDFLDLDWVGPGRTRVAVVAHGLEGSTDRAYVRGLAQALAARGWGVCAWNLRGCSGEPNRLLRTYHSGATEDLDAVVAHVLAGGADVVAVAGFSLGGNLTLRWLGEHGASLDPRIVAGAGVSVPVDLAASGAVLARTTRAPYMRYFLPKLVGKLAEKVGRFPDAPDLDTALSARSFAAFDDHVTAPLNGFTSAADYYANASALPVLGDIRVPTLLLNALDDPFLSPSCFPSDLGGPFRLLAPRWGGHVAFLRGDLTSWADTVVGTFFDAAR
ncbi:YheT family hydrolase [Rubrivirga sp. IMCC43871]|uniref:YheT family hydrolase n=1 Tax=Rubrivirga sp. IMCC43871 TaxID=3391575 RepID=UPI00399033FD